MTIEYQTHNSRLDRQRQSFDTVDIDFSAIEKHNKMLRWNFVMPHIAKSSKFGR